MANANQVIVNGETILDLRSDTVTPETLQKGYTAHDKSGTKITGTLEAASLQSKSVTYTSNGMSILEADYGYDGLDRVVVTVDVASGGGGGGLIESLELKYDTFEFTVSNVEFRNCSFMKGSEVIFNSNSRNVSFFNCYFEDSIIRCTRIIYDAIVNEKTNYVGPEASFEFVP